MSNGLKYMVFKLEFRSNIDISTLVLRRIAILGRRKHSDATSIMLNLIPAHSYFVRTNNRFKTVPLAETLGDIGTELETDSSLAWATTGSRLGISPEHLHHET